MRLIRFCGNGNACRCRRCIDRLRRDQRDLRGYDMFVRVLLVEREMDGGFTRSNFGDERK
jgi:hypothetical protein